MQIIYTRYLPSKGKNQSISRKNLGLLYCSTSLKKDYRPLFQTMYIKAISHYECIYEIATDIGVQNITDILKHLSQNKKLIALLSNLIF